MALAARPRPGGSDPPDARTTCPVCGGSIHPIAGRCKHCRVDLVKLREQHGAPRADNLVAPPRAPLPAPVRGIVVPTAMPAASATVALTVPRRALLGRWPVLVAILAAIAILVSVFLLVTGSSHGGRSGRQKRVSAPTMDRMSTDPLPSPEAQEGVAPSAPDPATPPRDPVNPWPAPDDPPDDPDDQAAPDDQAGGTTGSVDPGAAPSRSVEDFVAALTRTACRRLTACGIGGPPMTDVCDQLGAQALDDNLAERLRSGQCRFDARRADGCLRAVERIPCATQTMDFSLLAQQWMSIQDCGDALKCQ